METTKFNEELQLINSFYLQAWKAIQDNNYKLATDILYNKMPKDLYDKSINILFLRNTDVTNEELQHLIHKVDEKLTEYSTVEKEIIEIEDKKTIIQ